MAHATTAELATWLGVAEGDLVSDASRLLDRATEVIDEAVVAPYDDTDSDILDALSNATCAQVEFWLEIGEEHDISGQRGEIETEGLRISRLPGTLAPRARRALAGQNLLSRSVMAW